MGGRKVRRMDGGADSKGQGRDAKKKSKERQRWGGQGLRDGNRESSAWQPPGSRPREHRANVWKEERREGM